ncbi:hypothetical protein FM037_09715 [Shewanella psychropiezotolerans]|uniref:Flagellar protein FliT n=2 Tax=Shewanella psychropiezotolerans TaxID=2593655 RepID=A0ABX5X0F9_9GAMM|nr:hypothetical protein FM037_09715 [Shewanella psychropiezotolerans]
MQMLIELDEINKNLTNCLASLEKTPAEDKSADELVQKLHECVERRQFILDKILQSLNAEDKQMLEKQLQLTQKFEQQAQIILRHRQELLHLGSKTKRQINVYKSIGAK